ncbi:MAG: hypothetical protein ACQEQ7_12710 [Thermodesulfobacteriota bacterium]
MCTLKVTIREGTYRLKGPLILGAEDSGASGAEVVYQAAPGERVLILGSQPVTGWTLHDADFNIWRAEISIDAMPRQLYVKSGDDHKQIGTLTRRKRSGREYSCLD